MSIYEWCLLLRELPSWFAIIVAGITGAGIGGLAVIPLWLERFNVFAIPWIILGFSLTIGLIWIVIAKKVEREDGT